MLRNTKEEFELMESLCECPEEYSDVIKEGKFFNFMCFTDVTPGLIVKVVNSRTIEVAEIRTVGCPERPGMGHQDWKADMSEFPEIFDYVMTFTKRSNGKWVEKGCHKKNGHYSGYRGRIAPVPDRYYDWEF